MPVVRARQRPARKLLLLDIDGVLNGHERQANGYCRMDPHRLSLLGGVVEATGCKILLASAWRYMILTGHMSLEGFGDMMLTHGAPRCVADALHDCLPGDRDPADPHDRGKVARAYLRCVYAPGTVAVAIDDLDCGYAEQGIPHVRTDGAVGMTAAHAHDLMGLLNAR